MPRPWLKSLGSVIAIGVALMAAQPALAETKLGQTGTVGPHSLNDTSASNPGATCGYRYDSTDDVWLINRITVRAPNMKAVAGNQAQKVGWRYIVERRITGPVGRPGPWGVRYTSAIFTKVTSDKADAVLIARSVPVRMTYGVGAGFEYRVTVSMLWYRANGSVQGTAKSRVDYYSENFGGSTSSRKGTCWFLQ